MNTSTILRHSCRGFMLGIGIAPIVVYLREGAIYSPLHNQLAIILMTTLICSVLGCIAIPFIKSLVIYLFIERPLRQDLLQSTNPEKSLQDAKFVLARAQEAQYIDAQSYQNILHKLLEAAPPQPVLVFKQRSQLAERPKRSVTHKI
ncbi:MAG: hypothetical protein AAF614_16980 [Chloroflexota bacterium]